MHPTPVSPQVDDPLPSLTHGGTSQDFEDFIYLISHDVRSSVRALLELPQWIAEDLEDAGVRVEGQVANSIALMNRHTGRLDRMLVDLLAFSRIGRMQQSEAIRLDAALDDVLEEAQVPSGFTITKQFDCPVVVMGARDILLLLSALVGNAVKHHDRPKGHLVVTSRRDGNAVVISVSDDGPGIPEEFRERVFAAMTTLRPRDEVEGSGMGLANVRKIAHLYNGSATISHSPYGQGTTVSVSLRQGALDA